jgi:hypothetical protein
MTGAAAPARFVRVADRMAGFKLGDIGDAA